MSGQRDFTFSDAANKRLREYFDHGGVLVADCAVGSSEFDVAFRKAIAKIYPDHPLAPLPLDHPLFTFLYDVRRVDLAPLGQQLLPDMHSPVLEAVQVDGMLPVIYSPLSMSAGWEQLPRAYDKGYADVDALKIGVNVFMYAVTH
jgi:hypothetical protein